MGKKKISKKTKELSVAIAEASTAVVEQQITPRKRGRPRKIVEKFEEHVKELAKEEESQQEERQSKKAKSNEDLVKMEEKEATTSSAKDQPRRSRRKSKPRKSS